MATMCIIMHILLLSCAISDACTYMVILLSVPIMCPLIFHNELSRLAE